MDIAYIVGAGAKPDYTELRYSIRSLVKHLTPFKNVFIVGECPSFLTGVIHIPFTDQWEHNKARNIYEKILAAASDDRMGEHFICCSDDHFLLKDFQSYKLPYYYAGDLADAIARTSDKNYYRGHLVNTKDLLEKNNLPTKNFNVHFPVIYQKDIFCSLMKEYDWTIRKAYLTKSVYANSLRIEGEPMPDNKIHTPKTKAGIYRKVHGYNFFSTDLHSLNAEMKEVLQELYPDPSQFELQ